VHLTPPATKDQVAVVQHVIKRDHLFGVNALVVDVDATLFDEASSFTFRTRQLTTRQQFRDVNTLAQFFARDG